MTYAATTLNTRVSQENYITTVVKLDITSYTTGGEALATTLAATMPNSVVAMLSCVSNESAKNQIMVWDQANKKLMAYNASDGNQVTATTDIGEWVATFMGW